MIPQSDILKMGAIQPFVSTTVITSVWGSRVRIVCQTGLLPGSRHAKGDGPGEPYLFWSELTSVG